MDSEGHQNKGFVSDDGKTEKFCTIELTDSKKIAEQISSSADSDDYDPYQHRQVKRPTTNFDTIVHLLKGSLGTGILAMPYAYSKAGYLVGVFCTALIGIVCTFCIHILLRSHYELCKRNHVPSMSYPRIAETALLQGPKWMHKFSRSIYHMTNVFLLTYVLGTCCIYTIFVARNLSSVFQYYAGYEPNIRLVCLTILLPLILINWIRNLKFLSPFSTIANVLTTISFGIICYYIFFRGPLAIDDKPAAGSLKDFPIFFGTVLFALEAIYVIMPLENEMKTPKAFGGAIGVLNRAMSIIVVLYIGMGFFGYIKYADDPKDSITLNLPDDELMAQAVKLMLAFGIFVTHGLAGYVAIDITWTEYIGDSIKNHPQSTLLHYIIRTCVILFTFALATAFPDLGLFISLFGAFCLSSLGLAFPAIIETATFWYKTEGFSKVLLLTRATILITIGIIGLVVGTTDSLARIIEKFFLNSGHK